MVISTAVFCFQVFSLIQVSLSRSEFNIQGEEPHATRHARYYGNVKKLENPSATLNCTSTGDQKSSVVNSNVYVKVFDELHPQKTQQGYVDMSLEVDPNYQPSPFKKDLGFAPIPPHRRPVYPEEYYDQHVHPKFHSSYPQSSQRRMFYKYVPVPITYESDYPVNPYLETNFPHKHHDDYMDSLDFGNYRPKYQEEMLEVNQNKKPFSFQNQKEIEEVKGDQEEGRRNQEEVTLMENEQKEFVHQVQDNESEFESNEYISEEVSEVETNVSQKLGFLTKDPCKSTPQLSQNVQIKSHVSNNNTNATNDCVKHHIIQIININAKDLEESHSEEWFESQYETKTLENDLLVNEKLNSSSKSFHDDIIALLKRLLLSKSEQDGEESTTKKELKILVEENDNRGRNLKDIEDEDFDSAASVEKNIFEDTDEEKLFSKRSNINKDTVKITLPQNTAEEGNDKTQEITNNVTRVQKIPRKRNNFPSNDVKHPLFFLTNSPFHKNNSSSSFGNLKTRSRTKRDTYTDFEFMPNVFQLVQSAVVRNNNNRRNRRTKNGKNFSEVKYPFKSNIVQEILVVSDNGNGERCFEELRSLPKLEDDISVEEKRINFERSNAQDGFDTKVSHKSLDAPFAGEDKELVVEKHEEILKVSSIDEAKESNVQESSTFGVSPKMLLGTAVEKDEELVVGKQEEILKASSINEAKESNVQEGSAWGNSPKMLLTTAVEKYKELVVGKQEEILKASSINEAKELNVQEGSAWRDSPKTAVEKDEELFVGKKEKIEKASSVNEDKQSNVPEVSHWTNYPKISLERVVEKDEELVVGKKEEILKASSINEAKQSNVPEFSNWTNYPKISLERVVEKDEELVVENQEKVLKASSINEAKQSNVQEVSTTRISLNNTVETPVLENEDFSSVEEIREIKVEKVYETQSDGIISEEIKHENSKGGFENRITGNKVDSLVNDRSSKDSLSISSEEIRQSKPKCDSRNGNNGRKNYKSIFQTMYLTPYYLSEGKFPQIASQFAQILPTSNNKKYQEEER